MPYKFVVDSIHTKKLCSRLSSSKVQFLYENGFAFLRGNIRCSSGSWKARSGLPIRVRLIELFSISVTAEALRTDIY